MNDTAIQSREVALEPTRTALLFIDVQNFCARRDGSEFKELAKAAVDEKYGYFFDHFETNVLPNMKRLQNAFRDAGIEILYTTIESLTADGRDRSLDYKISGFLVPKGSWDGKVVDELEPGPDEIWLPKSSSSVFVSTHIDYILRNLGIRQLVISGLITDQCVESAVRDGCDLGYLITLVTDACASYSEERHSQSLRAISGYCRQRTTVEVLAEIAQTEARLSRVS